ncbi:hypothetical protein BGW42_005796 [Actinomortierella wolfii]|nr:hypothetical protein BGW42_005796 [Actinomortierella wolfii]
MLCHGEALRGVSSTVGCNMDVRLHTTTSSTLRASAAGTSNLANGSFAVPSASASSASSSLGAPTFIEFYDISGSPSIRHPRSRHMFYTGTYHGIILVHDLCNRRSFDNLWRWMGDFLEVNSSSSSSSASTSSYSRAINPDHASNDVELLPRGMPVLVVGNKKDLMPDALPDKRTLYGGEAISVCSIAPSEFMPNTSTSIAFHTFFSRVIDNRHQRPSTGVHPTLSPHPTINTTSVPLTPSSPHSLNSPTYSPKGNPSSHIPIVDFATFTAGTSTTTATATPTPTRTPRVASPGLDSPSARSLSPVSRSTTPTGARSLAAGSRPTYDRPRIGLGSSHAAAMGVPIYTHTRAIHSRRGSNSFS